MAKYSAPLDEIRFLLYDVFKVAELVSELSNEVLETEITGSILSECAKLCENTLSPLNQASDLTPPVLENGFVRCTPGFKNAYKKLSEDQIKNYDKNIRPVTTASFQQVREGIKKNTSMAWKKYSNYLTPMQETLNNMKIKF